MNFCQALISPSPPKQLLAKYFSSSPEITEHGPKDGCEEYFQIMTDVLEMSLSHVAFPRAEEGIIVDAAVGMVSVVGKGRFRSRKTKKGWDEIFIYRFSEFDEEVRVRHEEI
ncbi:hypothetical protein DE146DRAFT_675479 [Phaeosphaeria sp. MPI-PUGE-AT-0046c]|nr:hypothetical protein DE146DRAFT_675479 [Phaeosphaeria sp. MPI-PUGE-AT-0046c]